MEELPSNQLYRHIANMLIRHNETVQPAVAAYCINPSEDAYVFDKHWYLLENDVCAALAHNLSESPTKAATLFSAIVHGFNDKTTYDACKLIDTIRSQGLFYPLCEVAAAQPEAQRAVLACILLHNKSLFERLDLSMALSAMLGKPLTLNVDLDKWDSELTLAVLGPAWQALYPDDMLTVKDIIKYVLHAEPPVVSQIYEKAVGCVPPEDVTPV